METWLPIIIQLISGAAGGSALGAAVKNLSLGKLGDTITGLIGGIGGAQLLAILGILTGGGGMDATAVAGDVVGGGAGGAALLAIVGAIKNAMGKK